MSRLLIRPFSKESVTDFTDLMGVVQANNPAITYMSQVPERIIFAGRQIRRITQYTPYGPLFPAEKRFQIRVQTSAFPCLHD